MPAPQYWRLPVRMRIPNVLKIGKDGMRGVRLVSPAPRWTEDSRIHLASNVEPADAHRCVRAITNEKPVRSSKGRRQVIASNCLTSVKGMSPLRRHSWNDSKPSREPRTHGLFLP